MPNTNRFSFIQFSDSSIIRWVNEFQTLTSSCQIGGQWQRVYFPRRKVIEANDHCLFHHLPLWWEMRAPIHNRVNYSFLDVPLWNGKNAISWKISLNETLNVFIIFFKSDIRCTESLDGQTKASGNLIWLQWKWVQFRLFTNISLDHCWMLNHFLWSK